MSGYCSAAFCRVRRRRPGLIAHVPASISGVFCLSPKKVQSKKLRPRKTDFLMLQKPRTLGAVAPELLSHSFAPHFEPFFGVFTAKNSRCNNISFCSTSVWNGLFRAIGIKPHNLFIMFKIRRRQAEGSSTPSPAKCLQ